MPEQTSKNDILSYIKSHENPPERYTSKVHNDGSNNRTKGFGHKMSVSDTSKYISLQDANKLLLSDFEKVEKFVSRKYIWLNNNQYLSACHIGYCLGIGNLGKVVKNGCELDTALLKKFVRVKSSKKINQGLLNQRLFEIRLWYK